MRSKVILTSFAAIFVALLLFTWQVADNPAENVGAAFAQEKKMEKTKEQKKIADIRGQLVAVKGTLTEQGKYNCCIAPTCDFCALAVGKSPCGHNVAKGMPVCGTCAGGWASGFGQIPDVDPAEVKAISGKMAKMMYGMRGKHAGMKMEMKKEKEMEGKKY